MKLQEAFPLPSAVVCLVDVPLGATSVNSTVAPDAGVEPCIETEAMDTVELFLVLLEVPVTVIDRGDVEIVVGGGVGGAGITVRLATPSTELPEEAATASTE